LILYGKHTIVLMGFGIYWGRQAILHWTRDTRGI